MRSIVDLIVAKRNGWELSAQDLERLVRAYAQGHVPDYQMSAFLMAGLLRGFTETETNALTSAMLHSGMMLDLRRLSGRKVDKHSTGGVGDKVSIPLAPLVAACGVVVPMISGRGLGHSGGTLDKLESIPGFRTNLTLTQTLRQLSDLGVAMIGQTEQIAPADRKLYALRDVTGTIECVPYIAASIMSKKLAEGIDALVLDVKCGRGAFMKTEEEARGLAERLVSVGEGFGTTTVAWMTAMDAPLGYGVGNWPEIVDAVRCLQGEPVPEITELVVLLAGEMICLGGQAASPADGALRAVEVLASGDAFETFLRMVEAQGGDPRVLEAPEDREGYRPRAVVKAPEGVDGYVAGIDALAIGRISQALGAGRTTKEDGVDPTAGLVLNKKPGDPVREGDILATVYTRTTDDLADRLAAVAAAYSYVDDRPAGAPLLLDRYSAAGWGSASKRAGTELRANPTI